MSRTPTVAEVDACRTAICDALASHGRFPVTEFAVIATLTKMFAAERVRATDAEREAATWREQLTETLATLQAERAHGTEQLRAADEVVRGARAALEALEREALGRRKLDHVVLYPVAGCEDVRSVVHFASVPGQSTVVLCGWEGEGRSERTEMAVGCLECLAILRFFRRKAA